MRGDSNAGRSASRPRDPASSHTPGRRGRAAAGRPGDGPDADQSVFVPGYRSQRPGGAPGHRDGGRGGEPAWSGQPGGKGPVRGFPPVPGQPPPRYPGQFAVWNRGSGPTVGAPAAVAEPDAAWSPQQSAQQENGWGQSDEPWYTGAWGAGEAQTGQMTAVPGGSAPPADPAGAGAATTVGAVPIGIAAVNTGPRAVSGRGPAGSSGHSGSGTRAGSRRAPAGASPVKKKGHGSAVLAVAVVAVAAVAAAAFLLYTAKHSGTPSLAVPPSTPTASAKKSASPSPTPSATLNHILARTTDPLPLTATQLFPAAFADVNRSFVRAASRSGKNCAAAIVGGHLQSAVKTAKCTQVIRASYVVQSIKVMGTIGVLNLSTSATAARAGRAANSADFIAQLKGTRGVTRGLGRGAGIEEAASKGHYLILMWAQFTTHRRPRTLAQRTRLENFMQELFEETANISLTKRMVDGTP
jgi:hypothetical protein